MPDVIRNLLFLSAADTESMNLELESWNGANFDGGVSGCSLDPKTSNYRNVTPEQIIMTRLDCYFEQRLLESVDWRVHQGWDDIS
jgi:hypothetical protein